MIAAQPRARSVLVLLALGGLAACSPGPPDQTSGTLDDQPGTGDSMAVTPPSVPDTGPLAGTLPPAAAPPDAAFVYTCPDGLRFTARTRADTAVVELGASELRLPEAVSASGARYESPDALFWNQGTEALIRVDGEERTGCVGIAAADRPDQARLWGADFYGIGQEPGWMLEVNVGEWIRYIGDYGETRAMAADPTPTDETNGAVGYAAEADGLVLSVRISGEPCADAMSGQPYPYTVTLDVGDRTLVGCGMAVSDEWR